MSDDIADQHALRVLVSRYCRAIDRHDWQALSDLFHLDSTDDHGEFYRGPGRGFAAAAAAGLSIYERHMHSILNSLFVVDGDRAEGETYFLAVAQTFPPGAMHYQFGGRYLDRFERRDEEWRFADRHVAHDWLQASPLSDETRAMVSAMGTVGSLSESDCSYSLTPTLAVRFAGRVP